MALCKHPSHLTHSLQTDSVFQFWATVLTVVSFSKSIFYFHRYFDFHLNAQLFVFSSLFTPRWYIGKANQTVAMQCCTCIKNRWKVCIVTFKAVWQSNNVMNYLKFLGPNSSRGSNKNRTKIVCLFSCWWATPIRGWMLKGKNRKLFWTSYEI